MVRTIALISLFLSTACVSMQAQKKNTPAKEYKEDFSSFRPDYKINELKPEIIESKNTEGATPKNTFNKIINIKLDSLYSYNQKIVSADGYRILVYNGTSSEEARTQRNNSSSIMPFDKIYTEWKSPYFKVKIGDYIDKLEAYYAYARIVKLFPNAIVVPDKVNIIRESK